MAGRNAQCGKREVIPARVCDDQFRPHLAGEVVGSEARPADAHRTDREERSQQARREGIEPGWSLGHAALREKF